MLRNRVPAFIPASTTGTSTAVFAHHYRNQEIDDMPIFLRQSTASQEVPLGYFVDSTDGNTEETGLTIANTDIKIWKTGATTLANKNSGGGTHISNGIYYAVLDATDTDTLGPLVIHCHVSGALAIKVPCCVLSAVVYDSIIVATDNLQVDAVQMGGTTLTARDIGASVLLSSGTGTGQVTLTSGRVNADITHIATAAVSTSTAQLGVNAVQAGGTAWGSGAITAASIATDAIDADAVATDAVTEINTAVLSAISGIGTAGGAAINVDATTDNVLGGITGVTSGTTFLGTQSSGTFASTSNVNAVYHVITGTAAGNTAMDVVYQFLTGAGTNAVQATWVGYVTNAGDTITVSAWRHDTNAWESMTTIAGTANSSTIQTKNITLYSRHRGTSTAELGKVYLRLHCTGMTTPVVGTDQIAVSYAVSSRGTYSDGAVWLNTAASNTNTQSYVDGLPENPVSTIAAAITIATNLNLRRYRVANGSSITLAASHVNRTMIGHGYVLAFGGQDVSGSYFEGVEGLSGTATCPSAECIIVDSHLNAITIGEADFIRCHLMNTVTLSQAAVPYRFHDCSGITSAKITFSAANQSAVVSRVSGVLTIAGMVSTNTLYLDGDADVTFDNTNNTGTVYIAGNIRLTNNGITMSITDTSRWGEDQSVAAVTGAVGSVTGNVGGNVTGSVGSVATNGISAASLAADAGTEIATAVWASADRQLTALDEDVTTIDLNATAVGSVVGAVGSVTGNVGGNVTGSVGSVTGTVGSVTGNVGGNVTGSVGSVASGGITAASLAADAGAEIADAVWDEAIAGHLAGGTTGAALNGAGSAGDPWTTTVPGAYGAGTAGYILGTNLDATVNSRLASSGYSAPPSAATVADAVWDEAIAGHLSGGSTGAALNGAGSAGDPWTTAVPGAYGAGTAGYILGTNVDATVSSRLASASYSAAPSAATVADAIWDESRSGHTSAGTFGEGMASVQGSVTGSVASVTGAVGSVTGNVGGNVVGSVASVTGAVGSVTGNVGGSVSSIAAGGIAAASFAAGAIDATAIAANAIGASELAADAVAEIAAAVGSPNRITKNTALSGFMFIMQDTSGNPKTGLTVTAQRSIDGAALALCTNAVSEISSGLYKINLSADDLNGNTIMLMFSATGAKTTFIEVVTQPASA